MYWHAHHSTAESYRGKIIYLWLSVRVFSTETFCLWNISLVHKLPTCAALLIFHMLCPVQSDRLHKSPIKSDAWCQTMICQTSFIWKLSQYGYCCGDPKQKVIYSWIPVFIHYTSLWWLATSNLASAMFWHSLQKFRPSQWYGSTGNIKYTDFPSRATLFMHDTE